MKSRSRDHHISLDLYKPLEQWYLHDPEGIHGMSHAARVLVWAHLIGYWMVKRDAAIDLEVVHWAATLHDVRRINDGIDLFHGERAADWIRVNYHSIPSPLTEMQLKSLRYCCTWHVPHDHKAPVLTSELICLKDADSLDRVRLGGLDPAFLRTSCAKVMCSSAKALYELSLVNKTINKWEAVKNAALQLELWQ